VAFPAIDWHTRLAHCRQLQALAMRVLVTGASGFIGMPATRLLVRGGHRVRVLAQPGTEAPVRNLGVTDIVSGDLDNTGSLKRATQGIEVAVHLAGVLPGARPATITRVNEHGTQALLRACLSNRIRRFVLASSTSVYEAASGRRAQGINESAQLRSTASNAVEFYGLSKVRAEGFVGKAHAEHRLSHAILRFPMVYGSASGWDRQLIDRIRNQPWSALSPLAAAPNMQWIHVEDAARAILLAVTRAGALEGAFNIAGAELFSLREIALLVSDIDAAHAAAVGSSEMRKRPLKYEIGKARQQLGFAPSVALRDGLRNLGSGSAEFGRRSGPYGSADGAAGGAFA